MTTEETTTVEETSEASNLVPTIMLIATGAAGATALYVAYRKIQNRRNQKKAQMILDAMFESMDPDIAKMIKEQIETLENAS